MKNKTEKNMVYVGKTTKGYWKSITDGGLLNDYPNSTFTETKKSQFEELSQGEVHIIEDLSEQFLKLKKEQTELNGGNWIIWD
jgi:hypothetical protein